MLKNSTTDFTTKLEKLLLPLLFFSWVLHFIQVFVPETGFDAIWYHLPVSIAMIQAHGLVFLPDLYQSLNPLFSDLFFTIGVFFAGELGAKLVAYGFFMCLMLVIWKLANQFLSRNWSLLLLLIVSGFQVVAWQSASFYVDLAKATWEISALWMLLLAAKKQKKFLIIISSLLFSAALATKAFTWLLLPGFMFAVWSVLRNKVRLLSWMIVCFFATTILYFPFALHAYRNAGDFFYPIAQHLIKLGQIGGESNPLRYILFRVFSLPLSPIYLLKARDYVFPLIILVIPFLRSVSFKKIIKKYPATIWLSVFMLNQWLIWWFVPPTSTRYALSGFIILMLLLLIGFSQVKSQQRKNIIFTMLFIFSLIALIPRLLVVKRSLKYLTGTQSRPEYYQQFRDGNIDQHLDKWLEIKRMSGY